MTEAAAASVIIVTYNSAGHLPTVLDALAADPAGAAEVIVVDNRSTDDSLAIASARGATVVPLEENRGFGAACHAGVAAAGQDAIVFLNPDATPRAGWLPPLLAALEEGEVGAATATLELADQPGHYNTSGGALTYVGLAWASDVGAPVADRAEPVEVPFPSGAAMAMSRALWEQSGGFRPDLFMYHEDTDLGWRLRTRGRVSVRVPQSVVAHDYDFGRHGEKLFQLERNRWLLLGANYRRSTLLLLLPVLAMVELGVLITAVRDGWGGRKVAAWRAAWHHRATTKEWYRRVQAERTVGDATILMALDASFDSMRQVDRPPGTRLVASLLRLYRRLVVPLIRIRDRSLGLT